MSQLAIDHLVYFVPELDAGTQALGEQFGVMPAVGGSHPNAGTANTLLSLGNGSYLEIIAPDPEQSIEPQWFGLASLTEPQLVGWAARGSGLADIVARSSAAGYDPGILRDGQRARPDGVLLRWQLVFPGERILRENGILPFLIDWFDTPHPSENTPTGCTLLALEATHPNAAGVQAKLDALGAPLQVVDDPRVRLKATLQTPNGVVTLG